MSECNAVDIAVVGGGLVGTPLAIMLARLGWSVALFEQQTETKPLAGSKGYTALSDSTVHSLNAHQLWSRASRDACAIREIHVSHKGYFGSTHISSAQHAVSALGYVIDNATFLDSFQPVLQEGTVERFSGANVVRVEYENHCARIHCTHNGSSLELNCRLVIAVDGVSSSLRDAAGIATRHTDYDQVGILGTVKLSQAHNEVAYERFTPSGPLALLPLPENCASFVYCINPDMQESLSSMSDAEFIDALQSAFGYRLGKFVGLGKRVYVPLVRIEAAQQHAHRLLLMGNAMRLLHPVAGQGYNLAMRDVSELISVLDDTTIDPGDTTLLQAYAKSRIADHKRVVRMTDFLARAFRGQASMPAHVRALGLLGLDRLPVLRNRFVKQSMGHGR